MKRFLLLMFALLVPIFASSQTTNEYLLSPTENAYNPIPSPYELRAQRHPDTDFRGALSYAIGQRPK